MWALINSKYLLTVNYMPGPVLGAGDKAMNRQPGTPSHGTYKSTGDVSQPSTEIILWFLLC